VQIPLYQVDAFSDGPFSGNPAAVCLLDAMPESAWLQAVASQMNLSETAFPMKADDGADYRLRIFTPAQELPFARVDEIVARWAAG